MPKIHPLDPVLTNQIAAGEVIERPASVVKELMENALDAGATSVEVTLKKAGRELILVKDNGCGMSPDDARMCLERHATSKIATFDDLTNVASMGFRGEAIPSIASISHMRLLTRSQGDSEGFEIKIEGGKIVEEGPAAAQEGTQISIEHLFYNVPARRKFLKSDSTELGHSIGLIKALAMAHLEVAFRLKHAGKLILDLPADQTLKERIEMLFGSAEGMLEVQSYEEKAQIHGLISSPSHIQPTRSGLYFFVNGRCVDAKIFHFALKDAYGESMGPGHYPSAFVFLEIPPEQVDVNVHPAKREVRFRTQSSIATFLSKTLRRTLDGAAQKFSSTPAASFEERLHTPEGSALPRLDSQVIPSEGLAPLSPSANPFAGMPTTDAPAASSIPFGAPAALTSQTKLFAAEPEAETCPMRFIGFLKQDWALFENEEGLVVLSIGAAQEQVAYAQMLPQIKEGSSQSLLTPALLNLEGGLLEALESNRERLESLGFVVSEFGQNTYRLEGIPAWLSPENGFSGQPEDFLIEELSTLHETDQALGKLTDEAILAKATRFCRQRLSHPSAVERLLSELLKTKSPLKSPCGKATLWQISSEELTKRLG